MCFSRTILKAQTGEKARATTDDPLDRSSGSPGKLRKGRSDRRRPGIWGCQSGRDMGFFWAGRGSRLGLVAILLGGAVSLLYLIV